jgi:repressor LexA
MGWEDDPTIIKKIKAIDLFVGKEKLSAALEHEDTLRFITDHTYNIPIFESVSAGFGAYADDHIIGYTPLFIASPEKAQNTMVIIVSGDSMYPKIEDGDKIQVLRQDWAESGDIAVVLIDGEEAVVKKYVCDMEHETITLQSINPEYAPRVFANKDIERLRVLGVVENIIKPIKRA